MPRIPVSTMNQFFLMTATSHPIFGVAEAKRKPGRRGNARWPPRIPLHVLKERARSLREPTPERILEIGNGHWASAVVGAATRYRLFTHIEEGARTAEAI